ncbi:MAG: Na-translocating system protein MpsC family protein [Capsulimonas sp.]|uniref:Na-translocating system protein MpsC family protein n=1 Tax=Capsulimonas sp. TaxID=2494211 RepID=UPI003265FE75
MCKTTHLEFEAAFRLSLFLQREFGLSPGGAHADLDGDVLTVQMMNALTPIGLVVSQSPDGAAALKGVYTILYEINRNKMERLISRIAGVPVDDSQMQIDVENAGVLICFHLRRTQSHDAA